MRVNEWQRKVLLLLLASAHTRSLATKRIEVKGTASRLPSHLQPSLLVSLVMAGQVLGVEPLTAARAGRAGARARRRHHGVPDELGGAADLLQALAVPQASDRDLRHVVRLHLDELRQVGNREEELACDAQRARVSKVFLHRHQRRLRTKLLRKVRFST